MDYETLSVFSWRYPERAELSDDEQSELDALAAEYDSLVDDDEADAERLAQIDARIEALTSAVEQWPQETLAQAGAVIGLDHDGGVRIERGLVRAEDEAEPTGDVPASTVPALPARLTEDLTAQKTAAMAVELANRPDIALVAVVYAMTISQFYAGTGADCCLHVTAHERSLQQAMQQPDACAALDALAQRRERFRAELPAAEQLWAWCLQRSQDQLLDMLAVLAAATVDAVQRKSGERRSGLAHAAELADALSLDMRTWFVPGAENYFSRVNRAAILTAIDEANGTHAPALEKLKKAELAVRAQDLVANTNWLPEPMRAGIKAA